MCVMMLFFLVGLSNPAYTQFWDRYLINLRMDPLREIANTLVPEGVPARVINRASKLVLQSGTTVNLKPNEEPARSYICVYLAVQAHLEKEGLEMVPPRPPVPPAQFRKLVDIFRTKLGIEDEYSAQDDTPPLTPRKRQRSAPTTPQKTPRTARTPGRTPSKTPSRTPRKGLRETGPGEQDIMALGEHLSLKPETVKAITHGYQLYKDLVKDQWGLVLGLAYVVTSRAEPDQNQLAERLVASVPLPQVNDRLNEWVHWASKIVTGQTWISKVAVEPEPIKTLYSGPGDWGIPLEGRWWEK